MPSVVKKSAPTTVPKTRSARLPMTSENPSRSVEYCGDRGEYAVGLAQLAVVGHRERADAALRLVIGLIDPEQAFRLREWQRAQEHSVAHRNIAVVAPMPSASVMMEMMCIPGRCGVRGSRTGHSRQRSARRWPDACSPASVRVPEAERSVAVSALVSALARRRRPVHHGLCAVRRLPARPGRAGRCSGPRGVARAPPRCRIRGAGSDGAGRGDRGSLDANQALPGSAILPIARTNSAQLARCASTAVRPAGVML